MLIIIVHTHWHPFEQAQEGHLQFCETNDPRLHSADESNPRTAILVRGRQCLRLKAFLCYECAWYFDPA